jgi:hypothetical protein
VYKPIEDWSKRKKEKLNKYTIVWVPEHPKSFNGGWYYEHRLVLEKKLNRILKAWETVHHLDGDTQNNSINNLFPCTEIEHRYAHKIA